MVSINNNLGIGALKATAKAETTGIQKDDGQVTVKEGALFPQEPAVQKQYTAEDAWKDYKEGKLAVGDTFYKDGVRHVVIAIRYGDDGKPTGFTSTEDTKENRERNGL